VARMLETVADPGSMARGLGLIVFSLLFSLFFLFIFFFLPLPSPSYSFLSLLPFPFLFLSPLLPYSSTVFSCVYAGAGGLKPSRPPPPPVDLPLVKDIELMDSTGTGTRPLFFPTLVDQHLLNQGLSDNNAQGQEQSFGNSIHVLLHCLVEIVDKALNNEIILHSNVGVCSDVLPYFYHCLICEFLEARDWGPQCVCLPQ
jgi:hypothetical protein